MPNSGKKSVTDQTQRPYNQLADDELDYILCFLDGASLTNAMRVNRTWYRIANVSIDAINPLAIAFLKTQAELHGISLADQRILHHYPRDRAAQLFSINQQNAEINRRHGQIGITLRDSRMRDEIGRRAIQSLITGLRDPIFIFSIAFSIGGLYLTAKDPFLKKMVLLVGVGYVLGLIILQSAINFFAHGFAVHPVRVRGDRDEMQRTVEALFSPSSNPIPQQRAMVRAPINNITIPRPSISPWQTSLVFFRAPQSSERQREHVQQEGALMTASSSENSTSLQQTPH